MQTVSREMLLTKAAELLEAGVVDRALGWKKGEFIYDVTPAVFRSAADMEKDFVWGEFCGANFSKYLVAETRKPGSKVLVFLKPCDSYSFNQLLTEHRFDREKVFAIALPCDGMADIGKIRTLAGEDVVNVVREEETVKLETLFDGTVQTTWQDVLAERCLNCKSRLAVAYDAYFDENGEYHAEAYTAEAGVAPAGKYGDVRENGRFDQVEALEKMTPDERFAFWQKELSRCIRCNACRDVCPACTCEKCVFDNPKSGVESKAPVNDFEDQMFHIIRAFHVAGRCTDCGECSRVCPQHIPLHLLNRKFIRDIDELYGNYQAGAVVGSRAPLVNYTKDDPEPGEAVLWERGK